MKAISKTNIRGILFLLVSLLLFSCSKTVRFQPSVVVPGADARIKLTKDDNKNNVVEMTVTNLADPARLTPARKTYVAWMESNEGIKNIGQLISETSYFSSARKAVLKASTPFKPTRFFITAEDDASIRYPGNQIVLTTDKF